MVQFFNLFVLDIFMVLYTMCAMLLFIYGINSYHSIYLFLKHRKKTVTRDREFLATYQLKDWPLVTTQLPLYNESAVVERLIKAICAIEYPHGLHEIQVLDDSTDGSELISKGIVDEMRALGHQINWIYRSDRSEYKAGALKAGMNLTEGEFIAIFDADFMPEADFLIKTIPFLMENSTLALVQGRWGHVNRGDSLLTLAQSIGIDGHFVIEQSARSWGDLFMNFNGTAGIWRKSAIEDAGNWQGDTLTEDMDLSYRAQLRGWKMKFLYDIIVPAELPDDINAFKSQQYRWAKGSIQTAKKVLPQVFRGDFSLRVKWQALMHTTHYMIHPLMLSTAILSLPLLTWYRYSLPSFMIWFIVVTIFIASVAPSVLYFVAQRFSQSEGWKKRVLVFPILMSLGTGIAINNSKAVFSALLGRKSSFVRTPKKGDQKFVKTSINFPLIAIIELTLGVYCAISSQIYFTSDKYLVGPFLILYAIGFLWVGTLSILHFSRQKA